QNEHKTTVNRIATHKISPLWSFIFYIGHIRRGDFQSVSCEYPIHHLNSTVCAGWSRILNYLHSCSSWNLKGGAYESCRVHSSDWSSSNFYIHNRQIYCIRPR